MSSTQNRPLWQIVADTLAPVPDDQRVAMLAHYQAVAQQTKDLGMLRAVQEYRKYQEELRAALPKLRPLDQA